MFASVLGCLLKGQRERESEIEGRRRKEEDREGWWEKERKKKINKTNYEETKRKHKEEYFLKSCQYTFKLYLFI